MIGITSTVPQEVIWSSGQQVIDLNNTFMQGDSQHYINIAERNGFPGNICAWIKGIYGVIKENNIRTVIGITEGDCSTTRGLLEILDNEGIQVIPFAYPQDRDPEKLSLEVSQLIAALGTTAEKVEAKFQQFKRIRVLLERLDQIAVNGNLESGELYLWQLSSSDFNSDPEKFEKELSLYLSKLEPSRAKNTDKINLGYLGVPAIQPEIFDLIEVLNGRITFFEIPRQFCMIPPTDDLLSAYSRYTYPYHVAHRVKDIREAVRERQLRGLIHYTQSFCFRQIEDIIFKRELKIPILTLELDRPGQIDNRTRLRIESFLESLD